MKLSIITPTHNPKYMKELEKTILSQYHQNRERVILLNNGAKFESKDLRVKIFEAKPSDKVGSLKKQAAEKATGDIIVEVDHDDLITPDCLEEIDKAFQDQDIGFVYSDNAKLGKFKPYSSIYGRTYDMFPREGQELYRMKSLPLIPGNIGYIRFLPDHVRAWRKTIYDQIGGHDETLSVCDDQELMHRTYMVTKFHHIPKCLYIYRITGDNTRLQRNKLIQDTNRELYRKNIYKLATKRAELNNLRKIDLCGGFSKPEGFESMDLVNGDIIANLDERRPLEDNSVGVLRAHDAIEHLKDKQWTMKEIRRVLAPGGILLSSTPSTDGRGAFQDPTHVSFWNENSFWYRTRSQAQYIHNTDMIFKEARLGTETPTQWHEKNKIPYVIAHIYKPFK